MSTHRPISDERKAIYLKVLRETGSTQAAAAAATPHSDGGKGGRPGYESFRDEIRRDPEFAQQVQAAKDEAIGRVEAEIAKRAFSPTKRPIVQNGEIVAEEVSYRDANHLLLRLAARLNPDAWAERRKLDGTVTHHHDHEVRGLVITLKPEHLLMLPTEMRGPFIDALELIDAKVNGKETTDVRRLPESTPRVHPGIEAPDRADQPERA